MLKRDTLTFLKQIKAPKNKTKAWVDANRTAFNATKADVEALAKRLIAEVAKFDERIAAARLSPARCLSRLNYDMRFHRGETSYKHELVISINHRGRKAQTAHYFVHIEPGNSFAGGGVYQPHPKELAKYREGISRESHPGDAEAYWT